MASQLRILLSTICLLALSLEFWVPNSCCFLKAHWSSFKPCIFSLRSFIDICGSFTFSVSVSICMSTTSCTASLTTFFSPFGLFGVFTLVPALIGVLESGKVPTFHCRLAFAFLVLGPAASRSGSRLCWGFCLGASSMLEAIFLPDPSHPDPSHRNHFAHRNCWWAGKRWTDINALKNVDEWLSWIELSWVELKLNSRELNWIAWN